MTLYSVKDWNNKYENNRTRELKHLDWLPLPNKQDGDGYTELVGQRDGPALLGCWVAILQVASRCKPTRGILLREIGEPHTAQSLARMTHMPEPLMGRALLFLSGRVKWLDSVPYEIPHNPALGCGASVPFPSVPFSSEGGPGETKPEAQPPLKDLPPHLNTQRMVNRWQVWMNHRRACRKPKSWLVLFNEQIEWLSQFTEPQAFEVLSASIRNGWQGLFEPKTGARQTPTQAESTSILDKEMQKFKRQAERL